MSLFSNGYVPTKDQRAFHERQSKIGILAGRRAVGKTRAMIEEAVSLARHTPNWLGVIFAQKDCLDRLAEEVARVLECAYTGGSLEYPHRRFLIGGSSLLLRSTSREDLRCLRGLRLSWFGIDDMHVSDADLFYDLYTLFALNGAATTYDTNHGSFPMVPMAGVEVIECSSLWFNPLPEVPSEI